MRRQIYWSDRLWHCWVASDPDGSANGDASCRKSSTSHPAGPTGRGFLGPFAPRMNELGYVEGQNLTLDYIDLQGRADRYGLAMQQLVERQAVIIIAFGPEEALKAALAATKTIPIVMAAIDYDPGLSYASPAKTLGRAPWQFAD